MTRLLAKVQASARVVAIVEGSNIEAVFNIPRRLQSTTTNNNVLAARAPGIGLPQRAARRVPAGLTGKCPPTTATSAARRLHGAERRAGCRCRGTP
jgi:hypothetical protein